jgi:hypothetical protein
VIISRRVEDQRRVKDGEAERRENLNFFGGGDPVDPISACDGRDVRPQLPLNEPEILACARGEFEACLEQERV